MFLKELTTTVGAAKFETKMIRQKSPVSTLWRSSYGENWARSTLGSMITKPNDHMANALK